MHVFSDVKCFINLMATVTAGTCGVVRKGIDAERISIWPNKNCVGQTCVAQLKGV
jgi:hypothetical protein